MAAFTDKNTLKTILIDVLTNDKELFHEVMLDIARGNPHLLLEYFTRSPSTSKEIEGIGEEGLKRIDEHFKQYDAVFKALAKL